ncbi:hypothetical protein ANANG_G00115220 [Anguilla anguilla]|uniref:KASH domain-containing protein n=1 Tax=Anguilla anguilla TaxID=7936 RepID=A0A9D3S131_ANGAN|nr:hypothetical protein ANANG_G00115220 [Anguilla anguilla]
MSRQLLVQSEGGDCLEAKEKVHVIGNRLKLLLKEVTRDLRGLEKTLEISSSQQDLSSWSSADELDTSGHGANVVCLSLDPLSAAHSAGLSEALGPLPPVLTRSRRPGDRPSSCACCAALPLQLLLLLIIGLACLVPMTEEDFSCTHSNNFARSFHPMLRYTNGPPPI